MGPPYGGALHPCRRRDGRVLMSGIRAGAVVLDVNDLDREIAFWSTLLDMPVDRSEDWADLGRLGDSGPVLSLQVVPEAKSGKNRVHLDWEVDDFDATRDRALELGAREVSRRHGDERPWQVLGDPEGNEFCLIAAD